MSGDGVLPPAAARVQRALDALGVEGDVRVLPGSTRSAEEAAATIGTTVARIAKSLVFRGHSSGEPILVVASGANRVDEAAVAGAVGEPMSLASAAFVRERTGYAVGGVPPIGHDPPLRTLLDEDLFDHPEIWAAAGTPRAVFATTAETLLEATGGERTSVAAERTGTER